MIRRVSNVLAITLALSVGCADLETDTSEKPQILWNQILWNQILWNSLMGTPETIDELVSWPLDNATFKPGVGSDTLILMLEDDNSMVFMRYLVSCALEPDQFVTGGGETWRGAAGLCPEWADGAPSIECQEIVSACLLARNNLEGLSVSFSSRGRKLDGSAIETAETAPVKWTDLEGEPVASLESCDGTPGLDCGWDRDRSLLGRCDPDNAAPVVIQCGELTGARLRVCDGVVGCDHADRIGNALCGVSTPWGGEQTTSASFTCPSNGVFGVMQKGVEDDYNGAIPTGPGFPGTELEVYSHREGAFYGNIFDSSKRNPLHTRTVDATGRIDEHITNGADATLYLDMWACHSPYWTKEDAYLKHRLCALVETADPTNDDEAEMCAASSLGPCHTDAPPFQLTKSSKSSDRCRYTDAAPVTGDGDYGSCKDKAGHVRPRAITTYLDNPCAMVGPSPDVCKSLP